MEIFCNTDASWSPTLREPGLTWIFTNSASKEILRRSSKQSQVSSPCMGEALTIRKALLQAVSRSYPSICIHTDSQVFTQAINFRRYTIELFGVLSDIDELSFSASFPFVNCHFTFISMANNGLADGFGKTCLAAHVAWT